jgi:hypothetical protein
VFRGPFATPARIADGQQGLQSLTHLLAFVSGQRLDATRRAHHRGQRFRAGGMKALHLLFPHQVLEFLSGPLHMAQALGQGGIEAITLLLRD